jgi:2'-5' RNA ligase
MRLFVGLDFPWQTKQMLGSLAGGVPGARWVPPENLHLTLRFIGEMPVHRAEEIDQALAVLSQPTFPLVLRGIGTFTKAGQACALWVGVERSPPLQRLQAKIETALQRAGCPPDRRRFTPHITLARLRDPAPAKVVAFVQGHNLFHSEPIAIEQFVLFSSLLGKEASVYAREATYALTAASCGRMGVATGDGRGAGRPD